MTVLTLALTIVAVLALPGYAIAKEKAHRLFSVVNATVALFTRGAGDKQVTLKLQNKSIRKLDVRLSVSVSSAGNTRNKVLEHFSDSVFGGEAQLKIKLPHLGLYNAQVTALGSNGHSLGSQTIRLAALAPESPRPIPSIGVSTHFSRKDSQLPGTMNLIRRAGFGRIRDEIPWSLIEHKPGQFTFPKYYDDYIADALQRNIQPLIILGYANTKVYQHLLTPGSNFLATGKPIDLFENYVRAVVGRYGNRVHDWELWNEPNFGKKGVAKRYSVFLKQTYRTLKTIAPHDQLIACGGAGVGGGPNGECFLDMLKYGTGKDMDGYSIHPYMGTGNPPGQGYKAHGSVVSPISVPSVWPFNAHLIRQKKSQIKKNFALWVTEIGWFSSPVKHSDPEVMQAAYFDQLYLLSRKYSDAKAVFWYDFRNDGTNSKDKEDNFGLITHDYQPKPGYVAAATLTRTIGDRKWVQSLKAVKKESGQEIEQYGTGNNTVVAAWTTSHSGDARLPVANGRYIIRWDGEESTVRTNSQEIKLPLGQLPVYVYRARN